MADTIDIQSRNDLGLTGTRTGNLKTDATGVWIDGYDFCSTVCPANTGETDALQYWTYNGLAVPLPSALVLKCSSISVNGNTQ